MPEQTSLKVYSDGEIADRLAALPLWTFEGGALQRTFRTSGFKATLMLVTTVGHLCESAWHHPAMVVGYNTLLVKLSTHKPKGITDKDFALAARIDSMLDWRPEAPFAPPPAAHAYP